MTTRVWLLRHAETADPNVFHGAESDVGLSPRGVEQAAAVAKRLAILRPAAVISSGMARARATAQPIADACGLCLRVEPQLHERRVGGLSGVSVHLEDGVWPRTLERWVAGDTGFAPDGAESWNDLRDRVLPVWDRLTAEFAGRSVAVVTHGLVCKVLLLELMAGWSVADWHRVGPIRNAAVHELLFDGVWRALTVNNRPPPA